MAAAGCHWLIQSSLYISYIYNSYCRDSICGAEDSLESEPKFATQWNPSIAPSTTSNRANLVSSC